MWWSQRIMDQVESYPEWRRQYFLNPQFLTEKLLAFLLAHSQAPPHCPASPMWESALMRGTDWVLVGAILSLSSSHHLPGAGPAVWLTSRRALGASSAPSYDQCLHSPPWSGAELDLHLRRDDIFTFMLNPALAECLHSPGCWGDTEWIRLDSPHEGNHSPGVEIIHAGNITQNSLGPRGKRDVLGLQLGNVL